MSSHNLPHESPRDIFPPPDKQSEPPLLAELSDSPSSHPRRSWTGALAGVAVTLVILALVVVPLVYFAWPGEVARWRIASAEQKRLDGDLKGAIQDLDQAIQQFPRNPQLLRQRAHMRIEQQNFAAALEDYNRVLQLSPNDLEALRQRTEVYQYLGRHQDAVAEWKRILARNEVQTSTARALVLNGLAYSRALGDVEIDEALVDIDESVRTLGEDYALIDTRGYLYYRKGDFDRALVDLDLAVAQAEEMYRERAIPKSGLGVPSPEEAKLVNKTIARSVAAVRYHRALVYDKRGDKEKAEQDRKRVRELGFEPNDLLF